MQCVAARFSMVESCGVWRSVMQRGALVVLQGAAVSCSVLLGLAGYCKVLQQAS